jgi:peptidoglycan hydrolase-like protein with peptidoglycan-binding domain
MDLPVLKRGAKGDAVKAVQFLLICYGYDMKSESGRNYGADGSFGGATERALKEYQADSGLSADGSCGPKTWAKLLGVSKS